ncbi:MAG: hypothetical protein AAGL89_06810 [Pseudomonadota bacterium]
MKRLTIAGATALVLTGCAPEVPDSGQGVGFSDYAEYELERAQREAAMRGETFAAPPTGPILPPTTASTGVNSSDLAAAGIGQAPGTPPTTTAAIPPVTPPASTAAPLGQNPDISDEQSFDAVSDRETIESDAERRARQAAAYQLIEVTDLPDRNGNVGPNIVQYALQAPNDRGEPVFDRNGLFAESRFQRNCAKYRTPDEAQRDFLSRGGPQSDRLGLDPDGDGFACGWDPQAFRSLAASN